MLKRQQYEHIRTGYRVYEMSKSTRQANRAFSQYNSKNEDMKKQIKTLTEEMERLKTKEQPYVVRDIDTGEPWEKTIRDWEEGRKPRPPHGEIPPDVMMAYGIRRILQEIREVIII